MALRLLEVDHIRDLAACPKCGAAERTACDPATLSPGATNHIERAKAARHAEFAKEQRRRR